MGLQDLVDEAIADLLKKHRRPVTTKEMFAESLKGVAEAKSSVISRTETTLSASFFLHPQALKCLAFPPLRHLESTWLTSD